ncbi:OmpA/MotB family protein [Tepidibacillus sp. LV47]|uniref:OmpA/MotB family protein n=1 Tax=Tepidibacillus sp. LV47 TaxID=3398228 RepID=UPI003AB05EA5
MNRRKKKKEVQENHERWLITYADLITLLMIFFVVMYSMSKLEMEKFEQIKVSLMDALSTNDSMIEGIGVSKLGKTDRTQEGGDEKNKLYAKQMEEERKLQNFRKEIEKYIKANHLEGDVELEEVPRGIQISMKDKILFDFGKADLKPESKMILDKISKLLKDLPHPLSIEGHTDDRPVLPSSPFKSNFDLSTARAYSVLEYMVNQHHIDSKRLRIVGYGENKPVYKNDTEEHRQANRRVVLVVLRPEYDFK